MQVNNYSTNSHNKKLGFGRIYADSLYLSKFGSKFAMELKAAMPELEKRYGGEKIMVCLRNKTSGSQVIARKAGVVKKLVETPQNFMQKLLKMEPKKKIVYEPLEISSNGFHLKAETKKDEILAMIATAAKEARGNLRKAFGEIRAKKIMDKMN